MAWLRSVSPSGGMIIGLSPISGLFERLYPNNDLFEGIYPVGGLYPDNVWLISSNVIPKEDCRVFVLRCQSASHHTCPVLSVSLFIYIHTSQTGFMHIFIHSFIHIYMYINIHAHIACIQVSFIHNCIDHLVSYFNCISQKCHSQVCLVQMCHQSSVFQTACSPSNSLKIHFFILYHQYFKRHVLHRTVWKYIFLSCIISISNGVFFIEQFENTFLPCFLSISNGMFFIEQFENTFLFYFLSISNGMFFIEQFENTFLTCFISISNGMFFIEQFESTILPFSPAFQMACSSSNSLKICFSLFSHQYCKRHVLHRTVCKYLLLNFPQYLV